jgi:hypothetical protein
MATSEQFQMGSAYDFITYAPSVLGSFKNVRVTGIVDYRGAQQYIDPASYHANVFSTLPANSAPDDHTRYYYLVVVQSNGTRTAVALPWIDGASVAIRERGRATVSLEDVGPDDLDRLRRSLAHNGFVIGSIELN